MAENHLWAVSDEYNARPNVRQVSDSLSVLFLLSFSRLSLSLALCARNGLARSRITLPGQTPGPPVLFCVSMCLCPVLFTLSLVTICLGDTYTYDYLPSRRWYLKQNPRCSLPLFFPFRFWALSFALTRLSLSLSHSKKSHFHEQLQILL